MRTPTLSSRRVWGSLALALTNLSASSVLLDPDAMRGAGIHAVALRIMGVWTWGFMFLVAGLGLLAGAVRRSLGAVHLFGALSISLWTALTISAFVAALTDDAVTLSGIAIALFLWMFLGPVAMLLVPLVYDHKLARTLERGGGK